MSKKRVTTITVESERIIIHRRQQAALVWCAACRAQTLMLNPEEAAAIAAVTPRTIYRWVEAGKLHFTESPEGKLLVCLDSLPRNRTT
jgi:hypothetical protein